MIADAKLIETVQRLSDREAIRDTVWRYCRAIDRCDKPLLQSVYWPEATEDHAGYDGSAEGFIALALTQIGQNEQLQHFIGNSLIRLVRPKASVESYFIAYQRLPPLQADHPSWNGRAGAGRSDVLIGGRYLDQFECRNSEWRILHRTLSIDWWRLFEGSADWSLGLTGQPILMGSHKPDDPSYGVFAAAGVDVLPAPRSL
jgi:hypothetical protein